MIRWGDITSTCARWVRSYAFLEAWLLLFIIAEIYTYVTASIHFYCASRPITEYSRFSVCQYNVAYQCRISQLSVSINLLMNTISCIFGLCRLVKRMQRARQLRERLAVIPPELRDLAGDKLYTKTEIASLVVQNENLMALNDKFLAKSESFLVNQKAVSSELLKWGLKMSDFSTYLHDSTVARAKKQPGEDTMTLEKENLWALLTEFTASSSKLSALVSKPVDLETIKKGDRTEENRLCTKAQALKEKYLGIERKKIAFEKAKLQEEIQTLEAEKGALKAKAKRLGIEEDRLRTTTPGEFQKLVDAQEKLYIELDKLQVEIVTPGNDKSPEEIARLARDFRVKTRETLLLMNANDKLIEDKWDMLYSMGCITSTIEENANYTYYYMKTVTGYFLDHIMEDEQVKEGSDSQEGQVKKDIGVDEMVQERPQVKEVLLEEEEKPLEKEVLQVGDGLQ